MPLVRYGGTGSVPWFHCLRVWPMRIIDDATAYALAGSRRSTPFRTNTSSVWLMDARDPDGRCGVAVVDSGPHGFSVPLTVLPHAVPAARTVATIIPTTARDCNMLHPQRNRTCRRI